MLSSTQGKPWCSNSTCNSQFEALQTCFAVLQEVRLLLLSRHWRLLLSRRALPPRSTKPLRLRWGLLGASSGFLVPFPYTATVATSAHCMQRSVHGAIFSVSLLFLSRSAPLRQQWALRRPPEGVGVFVQMFDWIHVSRRSVLLRRQWAARQLLRAQHSRQTPLRPAQTA